MEAKKHSYIIKIIALLVVFCIIELLRLGYMRKDQSQQMQDDIRMERIESEVGELNSRIDYIEKQLEQ